jgi:hypothetical protein
MTVYASMYIMRCLACAVCLVTCSSLLAVAFGVDACVDLIIYMCPIQWIGTGIDRRRLLCLVVVVIALIAWAIQFIAGPSAGCVCVRPRVCQPGGPACVLEDLTVLELVAVGTDLGLAGTRVSCQLGGRCLIRLAQMGPWDMVAFGMFIIICWCAR